MLKKIVAITGCRSEYDILYPVLKRFCKEKTFDVSVIAAGAHLAERFGFTVQEIEKDGFRIADRLYSLIDSDKEIGKIKSAALLMSGLSDSLNRIDPDFVLVVGDREEAIVSGMVCTYLGIPLIHLCGGDRTSPAAGDVDEPVRHATSRMAALHFTMNQAHKARLIRSGEQPWRVINAGDPGLDRFKDIPAMQKKDVVRYFGFPAQESDRPLVYVIQHVISGEAAAGQAQMRCTLDALAELPVNCIIGYPNSDMGSRGMIAEIDKKRRLPNVRITRNIPRIEFVNLLRNIDLIVGNSSMALLEGGFLKIPAINVGNRNKDRMNGGNVVFVDADTGRIRRIAQKILFDADYRARLLRCRPVYGDGNASERIVTTVKKMRKTRRELLAKDLTY
ncbi:MAG TPA: UDP-N-acetylglucosamine 2-epimerase [Candidatus Omnitrophota bacterium]|nr:UDP-N-acetylglucosamine 2-epimerase [Candidatus Omnitrophota bacterium]HRZ15284.1 UDP-N-acetylglucosamine 2-epimerase [Candidatus Omnitrophota bacterium]